MTSITRTRSEFTAALLWAAAAGGLALLVATQPLSVVFIGLSLAACALLALFTPVAMLIILLALAPMRTLIATEAPLQLPLDIGQLALIALVGVWLLSSILRTRSLPRLVWSPIYIPVLLFFAASSASAFSAWSLGAWLNEWLKWAQILLLIAICLSLTRQWEWLVFGLVLAGAANALVGIYEFFGGSGALHLLVENRFFRAFGTFGQPNPFGGFMGLLTPIALMAAVGYALQLRHLLTNRRAGAAPVALITLFYSAAAVLMGAGIIFSWSRGSWSAFGVSILVMLLALPRKFWHGAALVGVVGALVGLLWLSGRLPASVVERINSATQETFSFTDVRGVDITPENYAVVERFAHWQAAINMATAHPWLGVGFGNYEVSYNTYNLMNWQLALGHAHNFYLNVFAETGIIGLVAYAALWLVIILLTWRVKQHPDPLSRLIGVGLLGTWTYLSIHSLTDNLYVNNVFIHIGVMLGLLSVLSMRGLHVSIRSNG